MNARDPGTAEAPSTRSQAHAMPFGATVLAEGGVRFRLWAPGAQTVELAVWPSGHAPIPALNGPDAASDGRAFHPAMMEPDGWYQVLLNDAGTGTRYAWRIDGGLVVPDPASRFNPDGVHGASCVLDPRGFAWDTGWKGRPWAEAVIYELHVGTFTAEGTYAAAEAKLDDLAATGITALELMPLSAFPGDFGWGYDGVLPYAPHPSYGTPDELKHFVQAAHRRGLMVFLDVVYNHFGPDGNYLGAYAPQFFSKVHTNPWGMSLNFDREDSEPVRQFFIQNALFWLDEYCFDGLRLDAIHAIVDDSSPDVVDQMAQTIRQHIANRRVHIVLENENNGHERLQNRAAGGVIDAQWNDDFHHVMHVVLTGESNGYYQDYGRDPVGLLARALAQGFLWEGSPRTPQHARTSLREAPAQMLGSMVNFLDNHDQSGNRAFGERMNAQAPEATMPVATALTLLSPAKPMLFFGQEFATTRPFLYFADWTGDLARAVHEGRLRDFGHFAQRADGYVGDPPPPCERGTFEASKLDWRESANEVGQDCRAFFSRLLAVRREWFVPRAGHLRHGAHAWRMVGDRSFVLRWRYEDCEAIELQVHLEDRSLHYPRLPPAEESDWPALRDARTFFTVGTMDETCWGPWSASWRWGRED